MDEFIVAIVVIGIAVVAGQWLANKLGQPRGPITSAAAAEVVTSAPTNVEDFLDRYPNV